MNERAKIAKYHEIMWNDPPFRDNLMVLAIWKASMIFIEALLPPPPLHRRRTHSHPLARAKKNYNRESTY